jgi:hypothetical protein
MPMIKHLVLASLLLSACHSTSVVGGLQEVASMRSIPNRDLDILFVVDDSVSTLDKQIRLAAAFPKMIDVLSQIDGGLPNLHIGVVTSDMGTSNAGGPPGPAVGQVGAGGCAGNGNDGALRKTAAMSDVFLSDIEGPNGTRIRNYTGELRDTFGELAKVGANGCGFEQHLSAMKRALENPLNNGFVRPNANLAIVVVADEDDCSLASSAMLGPESPALGAIHSFRCFRFGVACDEDTNTTGDKTNCVASSDTTFVQGLDPFIDALLAAKPDARMLMTSAILGDPEAVTVALTSPPGGGVPIPSLAHSCTFATPAGSDVADPGVRLANFLEAFPGRNALTSICSDDLSNPLQMIGQSAARLMGGACLDTGVLADASPEAGVQPSCEVADIRDSAPDTATLLPLCSSGSPDCYEIIADTAACPASTDHLRVRIHRAATVAEDSWTYVRCQLAH